MADDKYLQNRQLAYDLLKQEGYTDIGDSAEELFKDRGNSELAYQLLSKAGYTDIGKDYNEFADMLYGPEQEAAKPRPQSRAFRFNEMARQRDEARNANRPAMSQREVAAFEEKQAADMRARQQRMAERRAQAQKPEQEVAEPVAEEPVRSNEEMLAEIASLHEQYDPIISEYERRYDEHKNTLDIGSKKNKENQDWLYAHRDEYRAAKKAVDEAQGRLNLATREEDMERLEAKRKENRSGMPTPQEVVAGRLTPFSRNEKYQDNPERQAAEELYGMAEQTLKQGSKYAPGYEGNALEKIWTAASQFVGGAANNFDKGSLTFGASEGAALKTAREVGEKNNRIVEDTIKSLGYDDEKVDSILKTRDEDVRRLNELTSDLDRESGEIESMQRTYEDMVRRGDPKAASYGKEYKKKVADYNKRIKDEYQPLFDRYQEDSKEYDVIMSAVGTAVDEGLTDGEKAVLDALEEFTSAKIKRSGDVSVASAAGAGAEQSAEFMLDFILTGGMAKAGTKAAAKLASKNILKRAVGEKGAKIVARGLSDMGVAAARTSVMVPRNLSAYGEQLVQMTGGVDSLGRYQFDRSRLNAALNTALTQYIEYWSEGFGEYFGALEQQAFKRVTKAAPRTAIGKTLSQYRGSIGQYLDKGKFDGMFNEMLEEVVGSGLNALSGWMSNDRVGDKEALKEFASGEQLATLAFSFLPMSVISARTNIKAYNKMKERYDEGVRFLNPFLRSGAIDRQDLDDLVAGISELTPEEIKDAVVVIADKARAANGGRLPDDFTTSLMGYLEGEFAMSLKNDVWESSAENMDVVNSYTQSYYNPNPASAYDLAQEEKSAYDSAVEAGFSEDELELDSYLLAQRAASMKEAEPERAQVLMDYAMAKASASGLKDGYDRETAEIIKNAEEPILRQADNEGLLIYATAPDGTSIFITSKDATADANGNVSSPTGPDGLVTYIDENGQQNTAKAKDIKEAGYIETDWYLMDLEDKINQQRNALYEQALNTVSPLGQSRNLAQLKGQNVFVTGNGAYEPVRIERLSNNGQSVVISGDKEALKGIATAAGINSPGGTYLEIPVQSLYPMLAKDEDGALSTDMEMPEATASTQMPESAPQSPAGVEDLVGAETSIVMNGQPTDVFVTEVSDGRVFFDVEDAEGNASHFDMPVAEFERAMNGEEAPVSEPAPAPTEEPAQQEEEVVPQNGTIPVNAETGKKIYDDPSVTPEMAYEDLYGSVDQFSKAEENRDKWVIRKSEEADKAVKDAEKLVASGEAKKKAIDNWDIKDNEDLEDLEARQNKAKAKVDAEIGSTQAELPELRRRAAFWNELKEVADANTEARKQNAERQKLVEQYGVDTSKFDLEPRSMEELLARELSDFFRSGQRLNRKSVLDLVGNNMVKDLRKGGYAFVLSNDGVPVDKFVMDVDASYPGFIKDEQDAINAVGDLIMGHTRGELANYIFNNRLEEARRLMAEMENVEVQAQGTETPAVPVQAAVPETPAEEPQAPAEETAEEAPEDLPEDMPEEIAEPEPVAEEAVEEQPEEEAEETPEPAPAPKPEIKLRPGDVLLDDLTDVIDPWVVERLKDVGYNTAMETLDVLENDMGALSLDSELDFDILTEVRDTLRRELAERRPEETAPQAPANEEKPETNAPKPAESRAEKEEPASETKEESVTSQKKEEKKDEELVAEKELTEEEIRNSGYPDEDVIDAAVDYINGDRSFSNTSAYNLIKEYVRPQRNATQSTGGSADGTQLDGPVVPPSGVGAERSGGEGGELGGGAQGATSERVPGNQDGGVPSGEGGPATTAGVGQRTDVPDSGSNVRGGRGESREGGRPNDVVPGRDESAEKPEQPAERTQAGSTDIAALGGELEDLLKQFGATNLSVDRDINGLDSVSYSTEAEQPKEGLLSSKRPKKPTVTLSFDGLNPKQMELAGKIIFSSAKLGYAYAKTEKLTTFNDFRRWFKSKFGEAVMKGLNYDESSLDAFIGEVWNTKMKIDGKRLTLAEHASDIHNEELRNESGVSISERARRQKAANEKKIPFKAADRNNIAEALPQLTPGQWDDVVAIERQFFDPSHNDYDHAYGKGMMITNGTGTGKTYTGLGTIKRFLDQGKKRILLVAPASMTQEWVDKGKAMGIDMARLENKKDKGEGVVVTSYQNFSDNYALYEDDFDLVVYDECHNILLNQKGEEKTAVTAHKLITNKNVEEAQERLVSVYTEPGRRRNELRAEAKALDKESKDPATTEQRLIEIELRQEAIQGEIDLLTPQINALKPQFRERAEKATKNTKVLMLSATPFNTIENLKYAEGYIFSYPKVFKSDGTEITDEDSRHSAFMNDWFRGDEPMEEREIAFGDHLLDELETVSFRELENGYDHSRDFPDVSGNVMASRFNYAWQSIMRNPRYQPLKQFADTLFKDYVWTTQLFESMKASALRDRIKEHLDAGRKIVIFHDRMHESKDNGKRPPVGPPFQTVLDLAMNGDIPPLTSIMEFKKEFADILKWEAGLDYRPVHEQVIDFFATDADRARYDKEMEDYRKKLDEWQKEYDKFVLTHPTMKPEVIEKKAPKRPKAPSLKAESVATYNGEVTDRGKEDAKAKFNDDNSKVKIICVTTASGGAGLSLHDTTGKYPRVMIQTALPVSPIGFIQAEGRIFRWGNRSNAAFEYPRLGLDIEAIVFAMNFNAKAETVENLAHGFRGRGLKDSIMTGFYENSGNVPIAGQGIGGVEMDRRGNTLKGMAKAKHDYGVAQRKGIKPGDKSIPETVGYVMSNWGNLQSGDQALVPFAGRGSIARYMPKGVITSALEQDVALQADLAVTSGGEDFKMREGSFTELNTINKADVVFLNGNTDGGLNQIETMRKGFLHLSEGGRLVAIVPNSEKEVSFTIKDLEGQGAVLRSTVIVPNAAIDAGANGTSRIIVVDKVSKPAMRAKAGTPSVHDFSNIEKDALPTLIDALKMPERIIDKQAIAIKKIKNVLTELRKNKLFGSIDIYDENGPRARIGFSMANRLPKGANQGKYRFDALNGSGWYYTGKWFQISYADFEKVTQNNPLVKSYFWLKEMVGAPDSEFARRAEINDASQETIDAFRDMYRLYMKFIRAGFGLSEAQLQRVANGLQPEISASDIDTLNSYEELRAKFEAANHGDEERQDLYDKVAAVGEKIGLRIGAQAMDRDFLGGYNNKDNTLMVNKNRWNGLSDEKRAQTLLHEFIHSVTVYAVAGYDSNAAGMSDGLFDAAKLASDVYDQITKGAPQDVRPFTGQYSIENVKELLAEMANSETKDKLMGRKMWVIRSSRGTRVSGSEMDNAEQTTAWALLNEALDGMLNNFDKDLFARFVGRLSDFVWNVDVDGRYNREADLGAADMRENGPTTDVVEDNASNLTEEQQVQVHSEEFKEWFGDWENDPENASKIVDENGEPRVLYHGTKMPFWEFDGGKTRGLFSDGLNYFALDRQFADDWASHDDEKRRTPEDNQRIEAAKEKRREHGREIVRKIKEKYGDNVDYSETPEWKEYESVRKQWEKDNLDLDGMTLNEAMRYLGKRVLPVYINSRNPYNPTERYESEGRQMLIDLGLLEPEPTPMSDMYARGGAYLYYENKKVVEELKKRGYDSIYLSENVWSDPSKNLRTLAVWDANRIKSATDNTGEFDANNSDIRYREETDSDVIERLDSEPKVTAYRAMQFVPDPNGEWEFDLGDGKGMQRGNLYPPMSAMVDGKWREPVHKDKWERSVEAPEKVNAKGQFMLYKGNGKYVPAAYNPYLHSSDSMLNDQFAEAQSRNNLVVVEVQIPEREVSERNMNPYRAEKAKNAVGKHEWKAGPVQQQLSGTRNVYLSRWDKPTRIVPVSEVADNVARTVKGEVAEMPSNVVWPQLRKELEDRGIPFVETDNQGKFTDGDRKGQNYQTFYKAENRLSKEEVKALEKRRKAERKERDETHQRIVEAELAATNRTLDSMGEALGVKINRVGRDGMPKGHKTAKGYFDPRTGEMTICMDNVTDERDAIATVLHETVGHKGLRELFGEQFNEAMVRIYAALDNKGKMWVNAYMARHDLQPGDTDSIIRGMEEYMAHLAESGDFKSSVWDNIKEILGKIVDLLFGTDGFTFTDRELNYILRASYEHLKNPNWLNTPLGKAQDTLWKRELGINETDPNRPTDPDGPGTGILYRDGETQDNALGNYEAGLARKGTAMITENQNADLPVKIGMEAVMKEVGMTELREDMDYLQRHNLASSRADTEAHDFELFRFTPMLEQVREVQSKLVGENATNEDREDAYNEIRDYLYAVSGLERNNYKNNEIEQEKKDALANADSAFKTAVDAIENNDKLSDNDKSAEIAKLEKKLSEKKKEIEEKYEAMKKDWSGLTGLTGHVETEWREAEDEARKLIKDFKRKVGDNEALNELWNRIRACTDYSLEHAYKHGLLTRDEYEKLHGTATQPRMWNYYLPLRGFAQGTAEDVYSYSTFLNPSTNSVVTRKMKGRKTEADDPLATILNIAETEIVQGNDNWAKQALLKFVQSAGNNSLLTEKEPWYVKDTVTGKWSLGIPEDDETPEHFEARMQNLREKGEAKKGRRGLKLENIMANKAHRNEHLIHVKVGGLDKMIWVNGNPALAKAVTGFGKKQSYQRIRRASRVLSNLFTTYSLDFSVKNLIRDTLYSRVALSVKEDRDYRRKFSENWWKNGGVTAAPIIKLAAMWNSGELQRIPEDQRTERQQLFIDFMHDGGQTGYTIINSVNTIKRSLERSMRRAGKEIKEAEFPILGVRIPLFDDYAKLVSTLNEGFELLTRFTAYQTSRQSGRSGQRSASDAKEISVNFNRRGAQSNEGFWGHIAAYFGATHYFYNAGVQGFDNYLRLFKANTEKMTTLTAGFMVMGILTPLVNGLIASATGGGDDDWYWNIPEWVRRNNIIIGWKGTYIALPLPVEFRAPYGIGDITGSAFVWHKYANRKGGKMLPFGDLALDLLSTASNILPVNPVEGYEGSRNIGDAVLRAVAPDATMFIVDLATNRDYTGRPLWKENPFSETTPKCFGAYASTPKGIVNACQKISELTYNHIDIAPGAVRDFMNNYGGGFFRTAEDVSKILRPLFEDDPDRPFRWDNIPFLSGFTGHIDQDRSNSYAKDALNEYRQLSESVVAKVASQVGGKVSSSEVYDDPEAVLDMTESAFRRARIQKILNSKDYELGKMYRDGMNNEYEMKQYVRGEKAGQWYKSRTVKREGVDALKNKWLKLRDEWVKMTSNTAEEKSAKALVQTDVENAWHVYYDAEANLADELMKKEYGK